MPALDTIRCFLALRRMSVAMTISCLMVACGGARESGSEKLGSGVAAAHSQVAASEVAAMKFGAELNARDLKLAEDAARRADQSHTSIGTSGVVPASAYKKGEVVRKAASSLAPVYRFYNRAASSHFYTISESERAGIAANPALSHLVFEGPAFSASTEPASGFTPVYRFFNGRAGVHFYTSSLSERDAITANPELKHYTYEGIAYYTGTVIGEGLVPLYRFYVPSKGFHFYTASAAETNSIRTSIGDIYSYEGVAAYVVADAVLGEVLPHTGSLRTRCLERGGWYASVVPCDSAAALALNPEQDGHRSGINPMSYSQLPGFPLTSCVKDNVTGLIWEGKEASGARAGDITYSHFQDGRTGEATAYVSQVNAMRLCGYSDWRLPKLFELFTLLNYSGGPWLDGYANVPNQDPTWFPNSGIRSGLSGGRNYLAGDVLSALTKAALLDFASLRSNIVDMGPYARFNLRLVRGRAASLPRFSYSTYAYGADAENNVAADAWTGLQWRRCLVGQTWNGSTCLGAATEDLDFYQVLDVARNSSGWRLPNARELTSLLEPSRHPSPMLNPNAFPGPLGKYGMGDTYSSTLEPDYGSWIVSFVGTATVHPNPGYPGLVTRLVRSP